jgi:pilus assembly protein FimV
MLRRPDTNCPLANSHAPTMHFNQRRPIVSSSLKTLVAAVASAVVLTTANAAGLGKLTVLSALGQPLRAEIELTSVSSEEANGLVAKLANPDAFRAANIDFNPALLSLRFAVEQRSGRQIVRITSSQPMNEPFVDMLLELSWNNGRLVREYTFLLDPAELRATQSAQVAPPPAVRPRAQAATPQQGAASSQGTAPAPAARADARPDRPARAEGDAAGAPTLTEYRTKRGDTLGKIAAQVKPVDVSLDMMLVALYRANPDAFLGNNMNRLKSGQILAIPDSEALKGSGAGAARGVVVAHAADFNAYRNKLAGQVANSAPAKEPEASQSAAGKVTAKVQERPTAANESADKLRLSKAAPGATAGSKASGGVEDTIAREKEVAEATARVKELERNVTDLQKLAAVKSKAGADAAATATENATPAPVVPAPAAAAPVTPVAEPVPAPAAPVPQPIAKKPAPAPAPVAETSLVDTLMDNIAIIGAGLLVALLALFAIARRKKQVVSDPGPSSLLGAASQPAHSMYDEAGGQSVDTNNSVFNSSFSPSASQLDTNEVDPVAEADVYIAYGRDAQAEEILREALRTNPERFPVRLKLLEIYAARKDLRSFETQAGELYSMTRGEGEEWQQAAAMGLQIDPSNPLYGAGNQPMHLGAAAGVAGVAAAGAAVSQSDLAQQLAASFASSGAAPDSAHFDLHALEADNDLTALPQAAAVQPIAEDNALDFDLGGLDFEPVSAAPAPAEVTYATPATAAAFEATAVPDMDFHIADDVPAPAQAAVEADPFDIDFDMNCDAPAAPAPAAAPIVAQTVAEPVQDFNLQDLPGQPAAPGAAAPAFDLNAMNFDLPETPAAPAPVELTKPASVDTSFVQDDLTSFASAPAPAPAPAFDMSNIDLDLPNTAPTPGRDDTFGVGFPFDEPATAAAEPDNSGNSVMSSALMEMETKLDLAIAYQEIGDKEGARELLDEVIKGGNIEQVSKANAMRAQLA